MSPFSPADFGELGRCRGRIHDWSFCIFLRELAFGLQAVVGNPARIADHCLLRDAFFPVCAPALLSGAHPLRGPVDLRHHALIHDASMTFESTFPTWRIWLETAGMTKVHAAPCQRPAISMVIARLKWILRCPRLLPFSGR